ncbi:thermonuclease family protein [Jannaschia seosinensis]|uniref:thermonuclease family protein n=1 Tax=Jannaschia seosinensis TaxID=313367 RepID=UPI0006E126D5|nr:thermonuclease family protein [Jannaschia seosinensis]
MIDGDTIVISGTHIRLAGIDAPEMDQPWGRKAKSAMIGLCKGQVVNAEHVGGDDCDRFVAKCTLADGTDLSAALVKEGLALDWAKFSGGAALLHGTPEGRASPFPRGDQPTGRVMGMPRAV